MILNMHDGKTVLDLQKEFSRCFPFLKIDFFYLPHDATEGSDTLHLVPVTTRIGQIRTVYAFGDTLLVYPWFTAGYMEQLIKVKFGLYVQISTREKLEWVQTKGTADFLTLKEYGEISRLSGNKKED